MHRILHFSVLTVRTNEPCEENRQNISTLYCTLSLPCFYSFTFQEKLINDIAIAKVYEELFTNFQMCIIWNNYVNVSNVVIQ